MSATLTFSWSKPTSLASCTDCSFEYKYALNSTSLDGITPTPVSFGTLSVTIPGLVNGESYHYAVRTICGPVQSKWSYGTTVVCDTTPIDTPTPTPTAVVQTPTPTPTAVVQTPTPTPTPTAVVQTPTPTPTSTPTPTPTAVAEPSVSLGSSPICRSGNCNDNAQCTMYFPVYVYNAPVGYYVTYTPSVSSSATATYSSTPLYSQGQGLLTYTESSGFGNVSGDLKLYSSGGTLLDTTTINISHSSFWPMIGGCS
jgi:hypothetical protein